MWGLRGHLKIRLLARESALSPGRTVLIGGRDRKVEQLSRAGQSYRLKLEGVDGRTEAEALRSEYLQVREGELDLLPEGEYYYFQLIGLEVRSLEGREIGWVSDVLPAGENDVYVVSGPSGEVLIPAVDDVVKSVDLANRVILIKALPGVLP